MRDEVNGIAIVAMCWLLAGLMIGVFIVTGLTTPTQVVLKFVGTVILLVIVPRTSPTLRQPPFWRRHWNWQRASASAVVVGVMTLGTWF